MMLTLFALLLADPTVPGREWDTLSVRRSGLTQAQLEAALDEWDNRTGRTGIRRVAIVRRGKMLYRGRDSTTATPLQSSTKSVTGTLLGLLVEDGIVTLETPARTIERRLAVLYPDVTLRHFATMTSGYSAEGDSRWLDDGRPENADWSHTPYTPAESLFDPGDAFAYWDEAQMMFGRVLTRAAGQDLLELARERLFRPIGITTADWQAEGSLLVDGRRVPIRNGCTWLSMSAEDLARFGLLMRHRGRWDGRQLVPADWVDQATQPQVPVYLPVADTERSDIDGRGVYGFNWWVNGRRPDGSRLLPDLPPGAFFSAGLKHNVCLVIPEWDLVLVRLSVDSGNPPDGHAAVLNDVAKHLKPGDVR